MSKFVADEPAAYRYHNEPIPGKYEIVPIKPLLNRDHLQPDYAHDVAEKCRLIQENPEEAYNHTNKSNMCCVISNGTAVLGLGNLGALPSKPVMEGKAVLMKKFGDVDCIDLNIDSKDPDEIIEVIQLLGSPYGGINLEDFKGPDCFYIENKLKEIMNIPVFHDDQHGTAIITLSGVISGLQISGRKIEESIIVVNGAGAAGIACLKLCLSYGALDENCYLCDSRGVIYKGREAGMNEWKEVHANDTEKRTLEDALNGADIFIGVSAKDALKPEYLRSMNEQPIIFAMANPDPEIRPEVAKEIRPDCIIGTGRSDYPNQINNVMCFPFLFRGALDVRASVINEEMKMAAAKALAELAQTPVPAEVKKAYPLRKNMEFGTEYIIPTPFDPRLLVKVSSAVAKAAVDSGVAKKTFKDWDTYKHLLEERVEKKNSLVRETELAKL